MTVKILPKSDKAKVKEEMQPAPEAPPNKLAYCDQRILDKHLEIIGQKEKDD